MAISKAFIFCGLPAPTAYFRVRRVIDNRATVSADACVSINLDIYASVEARQSGVDPLRSVWVTVPAMLTTPGDAPEDAPVVTPNPEYPAIASVAWVYAYLKRLPDFEGAVDC